MSDHKNTEALAKRLIEIAEWATDGPWELGYVGDEADDSVYITGEIFGYAETPSGQRVRVEVNRRETMSIHDAEFIVAAKNLAVEIAEDFIELRRKALGLCQQNGELLLENHELRERLNSLQG